MRSSKRQRRLAAIVAVAAHQDIDVRPMPANAGDDVEQDLGYFLASLRQLANTPQHLQGSVD